MKKIIIIILILIIAAGLLTYSKLKNRSFDNLNQEIEYAVTDLVKSDESIRNCVLSVMKGDGSFS